MNRNGWLLALGLAASACTPDAPAARSGPLAAWDPVDEMFAGCQGACGLHLEGERDDVVVQPGASVGQQTYCPVSGAVFTVAAEHAKREVDGHTLWFCCEACAAYFEAHEDAVMEARGLRRGPTTHASAAHAHGG